MLTWTDGALFALCATTSAITSAIGVGGGMLLLVFLTNVLSAHLVIPIHGATQLVSNLSRLLLDWRLVPWRRLMLPFLPGALLGGVIGYFTLNRFSFEHLPLILGVFILLITWTRLIQGLGVLFDNMTVLGAWLTGSSLFIGSMGLMLPPILLHKGLKKDEVILTQSAMMGTMHAFKVATYVAAGFAFFSYSQIMLMMLTGSLTGTYVGKFLRGRINEQRGVLILKWVTTLAAVQLIITALYRYLR